MKDDAKNVVAAALVPLPLIWIALYVATFTLRAQVAGFKAVIRWSQLSNLSGGFVVICALVSSAALYFAVIVIMNLSVDAKVPVMLSPILDVYSTGTDYVLVRGTWTRQGPTPGSAMAYPLQTSTIQCERSTGQCIEARASVLTTVLSSDLVRYEIQRWTADAIVMTNDGLCAEEVFTIDLNTKAVTGAGKRTNKSGLDFCEEESGDEKTWSYRMASGLPVYWEMRNKARPLLLRVTHSIFGN